MSANSSRVLRWTIGVGVGLVVAVAVAAVAGLVPGLRKAQADTDQTAQGVGKSDERGQKDPLSVTVEKVKEQEVQRTVQAVGSFAGYEEVTVTAEVQGRVTKVHFDMHDIVRPGDVLLDIDPTDYELAVLEARTALEAELTKLVPDEKDRRPLVDKLGRMVADEVARRDLANKFAKQGASALLERAMSVIDDLPSVVRAREQEKNALARLKRAEETRRQSKDAISDEEFEQRRTDHEMARASRLQAVLDGQSTLATASLRLAMLAVAEQRLKYTRVVVPESPIAERLAKSAWKEVLQGDSAAPKSPFASKLDEKVLDRVEYAVGRRRVDEGEMVKDSMNATAAVFDVTLDRVLKYLGMVPEQYVPEVKVGQLVALRADPFPGEVFWGAVQRISPMVDRNSRTFQIEAIVPNADRKLKPGGFAKGEILTRKDPRAKTVPPEAVVTFAGSTKIFLVREGKSGKEAHAVAVKLGASGPGWVEVTGELPPGAEVITSLPAQLVEGSPIETDRRKKG